MHHVRRLVVVAAVVLLIPLVVAILGAAMAGVLGCQVSEAGPTPCFVAGFDWGNLLLNMVMMGWLALVSVPILMVILGLWAATESWSHVRRRRRLKREGLRQGLQPVGGKARQAFSAWRTRQARG